MAPLYRGTLQAVLGAGPPRAAHLPLFLHSHGGTGYQASIKKRISGGPCSAGRGPVWGPPRLAKRTLLPISLAEKSLGIVNKGSNPGLSYGPF